MPYMLLSFGGLCQYTYFKRKHGVCTVNELASLMGNILFRNNLDETDVQLTERMNKEGGMEKYEKVRSRVQNAILFLAFYKTL